MVTDFAHVGVPVTLGYDHVTRVNVDRTWTSIGRNMFGYLMEWPSYFYDLVRRRETVGGLINRASQVFQPYKCFFRASARGGSIKQNALISRLT